MKQILMLVGGVCAATAGFIVWQRGNRSGAVENLAHQLEVKWAAEHHTVV